MWMTVKAQRDKISSCENGGKYDWCEESPLNGSGSVVEHRNGHHWIENCNINLLTAIRERVPCWAGHVARIDISEICAKSHEISRTAVTEMAPALLERENVTWAGPHPKRFNICRWEDTVSTEMSKVCGIADGFEESVQQSRGWLQFAQDRGQ